MAAANENGLSMSRTTSQQREADRAERDAFDHALAPCSGEILQAARREVRHRLALGQFAPDDPTPEQLLDIALQQAWRERRRLSPQLGVKALALAAIFRAQRARSGDAELPRDNCPAPSSSSGRAGLTGGGAVFTSSPATVPVARSPGGGTRSPVVVVETGASGNGTAPGPGASEDCGAFGSRMTA